jgi:catechol 2,3-dioxygenase-like lactoylglutathione lyase family enzyme
MSALLVYVGLRVRDIDRSTLFYSTLLGLTPVSPDHRNEQLGSRIVLLRHPVTGQQLELNWYPDGGQFGVPLVPGEALDHIGVRVDDVPAFLREAQQRGGTIHDMRPYRGFPYHEYPTGERCAFVDDPDGNVLEVYDAPGERIDAAFEGGY